MAKFCLINNFLLSTNFSSQKETENLLVTINGPKKSSKKALSNATKQLQKIVKVSKSKKSQQKSLASTSLDLEKTQKLFGANTPTRVTVEVFDDAPSDLTPRADYLSHGSGVAASDKLRELYTSEQKFRSLNFDDERNRVTAREDVFVPGPGVTTAQVKRERERLQNLEESAREARRREVEKIGERKEFLAQDKAVLKFQAAFRGHIGRQKMSLVRREKNFEIYRCTYDDISSLNTTQVRRLKELDAETPVGEWIEVKDRESGDVWYYNTTTGVSQWDKPISMHDTMANTKVLNQMPMVTDKRRTASTAPLKLNQSASFRSETEIREREENEKAVRECNEILGLQDLTPVDNIGMPNGQFKPQLRKTILDAILTTRFDTVSTVLADNRWTESEDAPLAKKKSRSKFDTDSSRVDKSRPSMVSTINILKKKTHPSKISSDPNADDGEAVMDLTQENLTFSNVAQPGFENTLGQENTMCFGCWSAGVRRTCALHTDPNKDTPASQTMLLCRNWDLNVMRRRYRSEEIQEIFMKRSTSLRFDGKRKKFLTVIEHRHSIYRSLFKLLSEVNFRRILVTKARRWAYSLLDFVRSGQAKPSVGKEISKEMRRRRTKIKGSQVKRYLRGIYRRLPIPPTTGYSYSEREGLIQFLFKHHDKSVAHEVELIKALPIPKPQKLYLPRVQHLPIPRAIPMPYPSYSKEDEEKIISSSQHLPTSNMASWLEEMSFAVARDAAAMSCSQIEAVTPMSGLELIRRTKYPPPSSIKFATLGRKPTPGLLAKGGLSAELLLAQLVSTYIPAQYGHLMVMDKTSVSPGISPEITIVFESLAQAPIPQIYISRPLEHPVNYRRAPTIAICSLIPEAEKHHFGLNRPDQTGEQEPHGFRTSTWSRYLLTHMQTDPSVFTPSDEVVSLNNLSTNRSKTTHVDLTYPFCEPTTRDNSSLEFYHLLLTGQFSASKSQVFTALTVQEPGEFLRNAQEDAELGHLLVHVYRSWSFTQKDTIEKFLSDDGVPYWYHRRTGQTFWERPFYEEEQVLPLEGGTVVDLEHSEEPHLMSKGHEGTERRYTQGDFRQKLLMAHESESQAMTRRRRAQASLHIAKQRGLFKTGGKESVEANAPDSINGEDDVIGVVGDELSKATAGGDNSVNSALPPSFEKDGETVEKEISHIEQSMTQYSATSEGASPSRQNQSTPASPNRSRAITPGPSKTGSMVLPDGSLVMGESSRVFEASQSQMHPSLLDTNMNVGAAIAGMDTNVMTQLSISIGQMLSNMSLDQGNPQDMIKMGVGMGMAMMSSNIGSAMLNASNVSASTDAERVPGVSGVSHSGNSGQMNEPGFFPTITETDYVDGVPEKRVLHVDPSANPKHPIGIPDYRVKETSSSSLSHKEELNQKEKFIQSGSVPLSALESAMEITVVPTETPDEAPEKMLSISLPGNADEALKNDIPLLIYPELSSHTEGGAPPNSVTHEAAGIGTAHVVSDNGTEQLFVKNSGETLRKSVMPLPVGFFGAIVARHVAKQIVDYLPQVPNLPIARTVGRVKPRSAAVDWIAIGFDPWSAGRSPLSAEFIPSLSSKADNLFKGDKAAAEEKVEELRKTTIKDAFISVEDQEGLVKDRVEVSKNQIIAEDFKALCSLTRHAKFEQAEAMLNQPDWSVPIEYQDEQGNTLLHIAAQNGSKRLIKLALRRGAAMDAQNLNGQTALHFAYGYGYTTVGDYMVSKGADDTIRNKDDLTCYEGLGADELALL